MNKKQRVQSLTEIIIIVPFNIIDKKESIEEVKSLIGVNKNELINNTYISFIKKNIFIRIIAEINKIKNVTATIVKGATSIQYVLQLTYLLQ